MFFIIKRTLLFMLLVQCFFLSIAHSADTKYLTCLSENGSGRATAYSETNKIVTIGSKTHVAWLDSEGDTFWVRIRTYSHGKKAWSPAYTIGEAYDNHGGPALTADRDGFLHVVYYPHHHPFRYRKSVKPNDASKWTKEIQFGKRCTYPAMLCGPDDTLYLFCRESTGKQWLLNFYTKSADEAWQGPRTLFHGNAASGYTRWQASPAWGSDNKTIHLGFMTYETVEGVRKGYAVNYMKSPDRGKTWETLGGSTIDLPATPSTVDHIVSATSTQSPLDMRPGSIAVDGEGKPWMIYSRLDKKPFEAWLATPRENGNWEKISLLPEIKKHWPNRSVQTPGSIVFDKKGTMYVAVTTVFSDSGYTNSFWGDPSDEIVLLISNDQGQSFDTYLLSKEDLDVPNWLPNLQRPTRVEAIGVPYLIYTHGHRGENNKQIMSNEVYWCDIPGLIRQDH